MSALDLKQIMEANIELGSQAMWLSANLSTSLAPRLFLELHRCLLDFTINPQEISFPCGFTVTTDEIRAAQADLTRCAVIATEQEPQKLVAIRLVQVFNAYLSKKALSPDPVAGAQP